MVNNTPPFLMTFMHAKWRTREINQVTMVKYYVKRIQQLNLIVCEQQAFGRSA